jgi:uncharacterized protein (DUF1778 family)
MGRKRLTENERRDKPLRVRLRPGEREIIDIAADLSEMTASEWARSLILPAAQQAQKKRKKTGNSH